MKNILIIGFLFVALIFSACTKDKLPQDDTFDVEKYLLYRFVESRYNQTPPWMDDSSNTKYVALDSATHIEMNLQWITDKKIVLFDLDTFEYTDEGKYYLLEPKAFYGYMAEVIFINDSIEISTYNKVDKYSNRYYKYFGIKIK